MPAFLCSRTRLFGAGTIEDERGERNIYRERERENIQNEREREREREKERKRQCHKNGPWIFTPSPYSGVMTSLNRMYCVNTTFLPGISDLAVDCGHIHAVWEDPWYVEWEALVGPRYQERIVTVELGLLRLDRVPPSNETIASFLWAQKTSLATTKIS